MSNTNYRIVFPHVLVEFLATNNSDHNLIMVSCVKSHNKKIKTIQFLGGMDYESGLWNSCFEYLEENIREYSVGKYFLII